ncbi:hypothetical protein KM043_013263 [Ampulex compressa]|nr:hypothetical protein KM043_013263 [Ampulex compressa]
MIGCSREQEPQVMRSPINVVSDMTLTSTTNNKNVSSPNRFQLDANSVVELFALIVDSRACIANLERRDKEIEVDIERRVETRFDQLTRDVEDNGDRGPHERVESGEPDQMNNENEPQIFVNKRHARSARFDFAKWGLVSPVRPTLSTFQAVNGEHPQKF